MNKVRELRIDSTLWSAASKIINLLDFNPDKLSIETKSNANNDIKVHLVRYKSSGFLMILIFKMIFIFFDDKYHQVWKEILKIINGGNGELKLDEKIRLFDNDLPIEHVFKIPSITIVIRSLIEKNNFIKPLFV